MKLIDSLKDGERLSFDELYSSLRGAFPLLDLLRDTPQDERWHGEGDVEVHTKMVLDELYRALPENIEPHARLVLVLSAFFHDIAKTITTKQTEIDGEQRIVSPRHAQKGRSYLAYRLLDLGLSYSERHSIMALVGHHHDWRTFVKDESRPFAISRFKRLVDFRALSQLETADIRGRICEDLDDQLEQLAFFESLFLEHESTAPSRQAFVDELRELLHDLDLATIQCVLDRSSYEWDRGIVRSAQAAWSRSFSYRDAFSHLVVLNGPSGCGKTTFVSTHYPGYEVVSLDQIRFDLTGDPEDQSKNGEARQEAKKQLKALLAKKQNVVWDATTMRRDFRRVPVQIGFDYGAYVEVVAFETTLDRCLQNNAKRTRQVPEWVIERQIERAEFPFADEAHRVTFVEA